MVNGGFFEQIAFADRRPIHIPKRCRLQARQAYVFLEAGRLGWKGPWLELARSGVSFMIERYARPDGLLRSRTFFDGVPCGEDADNYDQAFAIFALASLHRAAPDAALESAAEHLLAAMRRERGHVRGGFWETSPGQDDLLLANPHMHLFEAALAWLETKPGPHWHRIAQEIAELAIARFIDPKTSALREFFDADWVPKGDERGGIVEPGHQMEWAWLLQRWLALGGAVELAAIRRLYDFGDRGGVDRAQSLVYNELWIEGGVKDAGARLWPQTERLKAALAMALLWPSERRVFEEAARDAWRGMQIFIHPQEPGLFRDKRAADGTFADETALASSLYHIVGAVSALLLYAAADASQRPRADGYSVQRKGSSVARNSRT